MRLIKRIVQQPLFKIYTWFDPHGIANIFLLAIVTKHYPVDFDIMENFFTVNLQDREIFFSKIKVRIYYFGAAAKKDFNSAILASILDGAPKETCLLGTVTEKRSWFTPCQSVKANLARHIYTTMGCPSSRYFQNMVNSRAKKLSLST